MKETSVVILNWNGEELLKKFLPSVLMHTSPHNCEIVVADNHSSDNSVAMLKESFPSVKLILLDKNYGFAEGYNRALQEIQSTYVVLLNSDVEVTENWLQPMIEYLDSHLLTAAAQPKILSYFNKQMFEYAGAAGGYIDRYAYPFCRGRILNVLEEDKGQYDNIEHVFWATGACLCIRRSAYINAGGLDNDFFAHMEEIDLCWRLQSRGKNIVAIPQSVVYHVGGASLDKESPRKTHLNFRNNLLMIYKNATTDSLIEILFVRFFLDSVAALHFLMRGKYSHSKSVVNGYVDFIKMVPTFKHKRKENMEKTIQKSIPKQYNRSIILEFYLMKKRTFSSFFPKASSSFINDSEDSK